MYLKRRQGKSEIILWNVNENVTWLEVLESWRALKKETWVFTITVTCRVSTWGNPFGISVKTYPRLSWTWNVMLAVFSFRHWLSAKATFEPPLYSNEVRLGACNSILLIAQSWTHKNFKRCNSSAACKSCSWGHNRMLSHSSSWHFNNKNWKSCNII